MNWIDVKYQMPEENRTVLLYGAKRLEYAVGRYFKSDYGYEGWEVETPSNFEPMNAPTHWMPLPDRPPCNCGFQHDEKYN
jgi:hypothetical protein